MRQRAWDGLPALRRGMDRRKDDGLGQKFFFVLYGDRVVTDEPHTVRPTGRT